MGSSIYGFDTALLAKRPSFGAAYRSPRVDALVDLIREHFDRPQGVLLVVTGQAGAGKSFRAAMLADAPPPGHRSLVMIEASSGRMSRHELLKLAAVALGLGALTATTEDGIDEWRSAWDRRPPDLAVPALLIDHAESLDTSALDAVTSMVAHGAARGLSVCLLGRPRLLAHVPRRPGVNQETLEFPSLTAEESEAYLRHRFSLVGVSRLPFTRLALRLIGSYAHGNPGLIDSIATRALDRGAALNETNIGERTVVRAARDIVPSHLTDWLRRYPRAAAIAFAIALAALGWALVSRYETTGGQLPAIRATAPDPAKELARFHSALPPAEPGQARIWGELLARWQVASRDASVADAIRCDAQIYTGLNCVSGRGSLAQLRRFDRPIVLELNDPAGQHVLLVGVGENDVRLFTGSVYIDLPQSLLARVWSGRFYAIYKIDAGVPLHTRLGDRGAGPNWIAGHLPGGVVDGNFDRRDQLALRAVQRDFGIADDGIAGPETLFALAAGDASGPHLARNVH